MMFGLARWGLVLCVLLGFAGQLLLQSAARPGEMPRATLERVMGTQRNGGRLLAVRSAADTSSTAMGMVHDEAMMPMDMPGMRSAKVPPTASSNRDSVRASGGPSHPGHQHDDGYCPLCPLLHLPTIILAVVFALALCFLRVARTRYGASRLPVLAVGRFVLLPPATGPPALI